MVYHVAQHEHAGRLASRSLRDTIAACEPAPFSVHTCSGPPCRAARAPTLSGANRTSSASSSIRRASARPMDTAATPIRPAHPGSATLSRPARVSAEHASPVNRRKADPHRPTRAPRPQRRPRAMILRRQARWTSRPENPQTQTRRLAPLQRARPRARLRPPTRRPARPRTRLDPERRREYPGRFVGQRGATSRRSGTLSRPCSRSGGRARSRKACRSCRRPRFRS
jgi:hypothetical protein